MTLRPHQVKMGEICQEIATGSKVNRILVDASPGAGKTIMALVAVNELVGVVADYAIIITPRLNLRNQFERDSMNPLVFAGNILRAAENTKDLLRGCQGYITTYQAISANPELHYSENAGNKYIVIIDEMQHLIDCADWQASIKPLTDNAVVTIQMTGTLDVQSGFISGVEYQDGKPIKIDSDTTRWITYSRQQAIEDGSILPLQFSLFDVAGSYEKDGNVTEFESIEYDKNALATALSSEAAFSIMDSAVAHWQKYRSEIGDYAQILFVDSSINNAKRTRDHLLHSGIKAEIATSDDSDCSDTLALFCAGKINALCTVGVAYEGLDAPRCTHIVSLTNIRSKSWIAQMVGRAGRNFPGKTKGYIFGLNDSYMQSIVRDIQEEQARATKPKQAQDTRKPNPFGQSKPKVNPLFSKIESYQNIVDTLSVRGVEKHLRTKIDNAINEYVRKKSLAIVDDIEVEIMALAQKRKQVLWRIIKTKINAGRDESGRLITKHVDEMSIYELEQVLEIVKEQV